MVTTDTVRPLTDAQTAALKMLVTPIAVCEFCAAGLTPMKMRDGRQYVHYDRASFRLTVCTGGDE